MPIQTTYSKHLADVSLTGARAVIADKATNLAPLRAISEAVAAQPALSGKWSRKEILGHLVDSAGNNTQRFVRAQIRRHLDEGVLRLPGYEQDDWVRVSAYQARPWAEIVDLWSAMNRNIVHVVDNFDRSALTTPCAVGDSVPVPIEHVIIDYAGHLVHHYTQIVG
jgi:hypothetical protein